ncbi:acyl-CoA dehydrogenase family protein [Promethearchaeum syntrophicum]|uniref:Acyl-CoA dehydrogenase family protein n=1 Tax=Promethearchaeum syntrophicum TaxID=2594042 RepID=A0A5B9D8X8_9ARCH|nr:acyl-CoA dehydrogenase family protein [Candidatus Prometheoarchaeum syntrophicum]QEE15471.1 putative acyl-CoA dehydrogenase [Candidatus Prometheoarchaeum syntrophicum]
MEYFKGVEILDEKIKPKVSTENIYKIFNEFIYPLISKEEQTFLKEVEEFLLKEIEPKIDYAKDVYDLFPILGKKNYMQRLNPYGDSKHFGMRYELLLAMAVSIMDPELDLARVVSGLIFTNPIFQHGKNARMQEILADVLSGNKIGCICITETTQGSDAVNMKTTVKEDSDYISVSGEKIFTTNGPKADYFIVYAVSDIADPRKTMFQAIAERKFGGLETHRLNINAVPRVHIGQTLFNSVKIPKENIIGGAGQGYSNLFSGLVAERGDIVGSSLGVSWLSLITAFIYTNFREQFKKPIYSFEGVAFPMSDLFSELMAATTLGLHMGSEYKKLVEKPEYKFIRYNAALSSGVKTVVSRLSHKIAYEAQHLCGGVAYTDNLRMDRTLEVSRIQEVIGGSRNIQSFLVSRVIKDILKKLD